MKLFELEQKIELVAPLHLAMDFDHVGLLMGDDNKEVNKVLVSLDLTEAVVDEAIEKNVDLIVTHHPLFFEPVYAITTRDAKGRMILKLAEHQIAYYAAHTNMDVAKGGINDYLCDLLGLDHRVVLEPTVGTDGLGRIGMLAEKMGAEQFLQHVRNVLRCPRVLYAGEMKSVQKVAVCSGSGTSLIERALASGADALVTADLKYSAAQQLEGEPLLVVDAGHFGTEVFFCEIIRRILDGFVSVEIAENNSDYIKSLTF